MAYLRSPHQELGATPGARFTSNASAALRTALQPTADGSLSGTGLIVLGGLGLAAYLLYKRFAKKSAPASSPASSVPSIPQVLS